MTAPDVAPSNFVSHARVIGAITFVSRLLGLAREMIVARYFGPGPVTDAFKYAFVLPNLFRKLLGEGALSAAFIPLYARAVRRRDADPAGDDPSALASATVTLQLLALVAVTLLGELALVATLQFNDALRPETRLGLKLAALMLPYVVFVCASALLGGILQVHRRFVATTLTAVVLNVLMIIAIVLAARAHDLSTDAGQRAAVWWLAASVLVAGAAQVALLGPSLAACGFRFRPTARFWTPAVRQMLRMSVPVALGLGVLQVGVVVDKQISLICSPQSDGQTVGRFLGLEFSLPMARGALTRLDWAQYLYQFPLGVFGIAIATAIFPQLSGDALDADRARFRDALARGVRASMFIGLPASAGLCVVALPAVRLLFEHGKFDYADSLLTARSTAIYASVIWAFSVQQILNRGFYALHDMRTPLVWALLNLLINLAVELPLLWRMGESAMAVGTAASFLVQTSAMGALLARRVGLPVGEVLRPVGRMLVATIGMTIACAAVRWLVPWPATAIGNAALLAGVMTAGGATYFGLCALLGVPMEGVLPARIRALLPQFTRRRGRVR